MKWLPALFIIAYSCAALAADDVTQLKPGVTSPKPGIVIIDNKKFFPLQNARRFTGTPSQTVMHHPREKAVTVTRGTKSTIQGTAPTSAATGSSGKAEPNDVLSVFAPEDKTPSAVLVPGGAPAPVIKQ